MIKLKYIIGITAILAGTMACNPSRDYEDLLSGTDDHTQDSGIDFGESGGRDMSQWSNAMLFPGVVDTLTEKPLDETVVELDLDKSYVSEKDVDFIAMPPAIYSTGLWAGAGERVVVELDQEIKGLSVQIGVHQDLTTLANKGSYIGRSAKVVTSQPLFKGTTEISNPWGGYIWIRRSGTDGSGKLTLKLRHVYQAPDFILGETDKDAAAWIERIKQSTVPYIELRGKRVAFTVPIAYVKRKATSVEFVSTLAQALTEYDEYLECLWAFYGMDDSKDGWPIPDFPSRVVMDVHLINERSSCFGVNGGNTDAIELVQSEELFDVLTQPWSVIQPYGEAANVFAWWYLNYKPAKWETFMYAVPSNKMSGIYGMLPSLRYLMKDHWKKGYYTLWAYTKTGSFSIVKTDWSQAVLEDEMTQKAEWADIDSVKAYVNTNQTAIGFLSQIMAYQSPDDPAKNGWTFFGNFYREFYGSSLYNSQVMSRMLSSLAEYFKRDFTCMFDRYGINILDENRLEAMQYKPIEKELWLYNVRQENEGLLPAYDGRCPYTPSGKSPFHHDRSKWKAAAYGKGNGAKMEDEEEKEVLIDGVWTKRNYYNSSYAPGKLIDGSTNTYWQSYSDNWSKYTDENGIEHYPYKKDSLYYKAKSPDYGYYVVIGTDKALNKLDGFYWVNGESSYGKSWLFEDSYQWGLRYSYAPQHVIVEITEDELVWNEDDEAWDGAVGNNTSVRWTKVYDSDADTYFNPDARNSYYIDLSRSYTNVRGIRLTFDRDSHKTKDKPSWWDEQKYPNRPDKANTYLNRIQQFAEFGTIYYNESTRK